VNNRLLDISILKSDGWKKAWEFLFAGGTRCSLCDQVNGDLWNRICPECIDQVPWIGPPICEDCGRSMASASTGAGAIPYADSGVVPLTLRCRDCIRRGSSPFIRNRSAVSYDDPIVTWLQSYKFKGVQRLARPLSEMMLQAYWIHYADVPFDAITYIPLYEGRLIERGFNQAEQMANHVSRRTGIPLTPMLKRNRNTDKQSQRNRLSRLTLLQGAFEIHPDAEDNMKKRKREFHSIKRILLIDDVYTTGGTVGEAASVLRSRWDADVYVLTLAR
jgi:competence protein ComFC